MRSMYAALAVLAACGSAGSPMSSSTATDRAPNATVVHVVDGDTVDVMIDGIRERVRLIGIDTPETKKENTPVQCFGPEATAFTASLVPEATPVHVERDVEARDQYGRLLAYVYRGNDGLFVNLEIVRRGFARPLTIPPNVTFADDFVEASRSAERENIGLWAGCAG